MGTAAARPSSPDNKCLNEEVVAGEIIDGEVVEVEVELPPTRACKRPNCAAKPKRQRLTIDLSIEGYERLKELAALDALSKVEVVRRALAVYDAIKRGRLAGEEPAMIRDGKVVARLVGI
jgi:hypothetical protein